LQYNIIRTDTLFSSRSKAADAQYKTMVDTDSKTLGLNGLVLSNQHALKILQNELFQATVAARNSLVRMCHAPQQYTR